MIRVAGQLVRPPVNVLLQFLYDLDSSLSRLLQFLAHAAMQQAKGFLIVAGQGRRAHRACVSYRFIEECCRSFDFISALGALPECRRAHRLVIGASFFKFSIDDLLAIRVCLSDEVVQKQTISICVASRLSKAS
ncbi:MAG TPA: hypothetical protein VIX91_02960 [Candidatus Acidoferrum sp.]